MYQLSHLRLERLSHILMGSNKLNSHLSRARPTTLRASRSNRSPHLHTLPVPCAPRPSYYRDLN
jgi:hypothetical protein